MGFEKDTAIPLYIERESNEPETVIRRYMFPLPRHPLDGMFSNADLGGVTATYRWAPRYKCLLLYSTETFCGCRKRAWLRGEVRGAVRRL